MKKVKSITIFTNGIVAVFDKDGQQMPEHQNPCIAYDNIRKLAKLIVKYDINPKIQFGNLYNWRDELVEHIRLERKWAKDKGSKG